MQISVGACWPDSPREIPLTVKFRTHCEVWIPWSSADFETVAHEGVHVAHWALEKVGQSREKLMEIVPPDDMAWGYGIRSVQEEARAWLTDQFVWQFCKHVIDRGLSFDLFIPRRLSGD